MAIPGRQSLRERLNLSAYAIRYPWLTVGFWLGVMLAGALAHLPYSLIIIFALPLSVSAAVLAILFTGKEFGVILMIGIVFLLGFINKSFVQNCR